MTTLEKLIDQDPGEAVMCLRAMADMNDDLQASMEDWHLSWLEHDAPYETKFELIREWFESDEADDTEKWEAIATWAEFTPGGREIMRLTAKEICPELFIKPQLETGDTTLADTYRTELLQKIADTHSTQELEKLAGI